MVYAQNHRLWAPRRASPETTPLVNRVQSRFIELAYTRRSDVVVVSSRQLDRLVPTEDYGFWATFVAHPRFATDYRPERVLGTTSSDFTGGNYTYWVYRRSSGEQ